MKKSELKDLITATRYSLENKVNDLYSRVNVLEQNAKTNANPMKIFEEYVTRKLIEYNQTSKDYVDKHFYNLIIPRIEKLESQLSPTSKDNQKIKDSIRADLDKIEKRLAESALKTIEDRMNSFDVAYNGLIKIIRTEIKAGDDKLTDLLSRKEIEIYNALNEVSSKQCDVGVSIDHHTREIGEIYETLSENINLRKHLADNMEILNSRHTNLLSMVNDQSESIATLKNTVDNDSQQKDQCYTELCERFKSERDYMYKINIDLRTRDTEIDGLHSKYRHLEYAFGGTIAAFIFSLVLHWVI